MPRPADFEAFWDANLGSRGHFRSILLTRLETVRNGDLHGRKAGYPNWSSKDPFPPRPLRK